MNRSTIKKSIKIFLQSINTDYLNEDIIKNTPERVTKSWLEMLNGYNIDDKNFYKTFPTINNNLVVVKDIDFTSICEHHLMPFTGKISIGYIPKNYVLGLSKFARIVNCFAHRLQLQEKLMQNIANSILTNLQIDDIFIVAKAHHSCMLCRGVKQTNSSTITIFSNGKFKNYKENELLQLI